MVTETLYHTFQDNYNFNDVFIFSQYKYINIQISNGT